MARLPALHTAALHLLQQLLRVGRGSMLPHLANAGRLLADQLRNKCGAGTPCGVRQQVHPHLVPICGFCDRLPVTQAWRCALGC